MVSSASLYVMPLFAEMIQLLGVRFVVVLDGIDNVGVKAEARPVYGVLYVIVVT